MLCSAKTSSAITEHYDRVNGLSCLVRQGRIFLSLAYVRFREKFTFSIACPTWDFWWGTILGGFPTPLYRQRSPERGAPVFAVAGGLQGIFGGRGSVLTQAAGVLSGTKDQTTSLQRFGAAFDAVVRQTLRLEKGLGEREAGDVPWLASQTVPALLALEVARRKTTIAEGDSTTDCGDGNQQSNLGAGASGQRTLAQTRDSGVARER